MLQSALSSGVLDQVLSQFLVALKQDYRSLGDFAKDLFIYLALIQVVVSGLWLMFKADLIETTVKMVQIIFSMAIFLTLMQKAGTWMPQIINGFVAMGSKSSGTSTLTPSTVMDQGVSIAFAIMDNFSNWGWVTHPLGSMMACIIMISIIVLYALLSAEMAIILVKSYVLISISGVMFAFGAQENLRPISMNYFKSIIGIGLQLMTFYLLMGVGAKIGSDWTGLIKAAADNHELKPFLVVLSAVIVFYMIMKNVPPFIAGLVGIGGFRSYGDAAVGSAISAGTMGANALAKVKANASSTMQEAGHHLKFGKHTWDLASHMSREAEGNAFHATKKTLGGIASSVGGAIKDAVMNTNKQMSFGQNINERMANYVAKSVAKNSRSGAPGPDFQSNQVHKGD